ncbi:hypothetical protein [Metabacillus niabensis]|uniref:hypothetical protein n=1 Tax=Metabacillus niabensis TaxID=324854 RepID=UPI00399F2C09
MINFWNNATKYKEARYAAGMNFDLEEIEPFLNHLSNSILDSGLTQEEINMILSEIAEMNEDNELKEFGTFDVIYKGKPSKIRVQAEIHIEDEDKELVLYMYSTKKLVDVIEKEMLKVEEQREY